MKIWKTMIITTALALASVGNVYACNNSQQLEGIIRDYQQRTPKWNPLDNAPPTIVPPTGLWASPPGGWNKFGD